MEADIVFCIASLENFDIEFQRNVVSYFLNVSKQVRTISEHKTSPSSSRNFNNKK